MIVSPNTQRDYPLDFFLQPMKPAKPPKSVSGQTKLKTILQSNDYIAEEKIDGCHYFCVGGRFFGPRISDTDGLPVEKTNQLDHLSSILAPMGSNLILDGEVWYPGWKSQHVITITGSLPDVALRKQEESDTWLKYMVFDVLRNHKGYWMYKLPWKMRRKYLEELFEETELESSGLVFLSPIVTENKERFLQELLSQGKEGIVLKHIEKPYFLGKRPAWNWVKIKVEMEDDVVIMGFEPPERIYTGKYVENWKYWAKRTEDRHIHPPGVTETITRGPCPGPDWDPVTKHYAHNWIGSIIFGKYVGDQLVKLGTCSGMDEATREKFSRNKAEYIGRVMTVKMMEYTPDGAYRHCSFIKLHEDKNPRECVLKQS